MKIVIGVTLRYVLKILTWGYWSCTRKPYIGTYQNNNVSTYKLFLEQRSSTIALASHNECRSDELKLLNNQMNAEDCIKIDAQDKTKWLCKMGPVDE